MILNGNQRGGGLKLAAHLTNEIDNDQVAVVELRGFTADTLRGALQEADAVARGTRCQQYLFSLSVNPPEMERVSTDDILDAIERTEKKLGLDGQSRAIVFHEKKGRRHAHVVWSRIDVMEVKAINLPFYHNRLKEVSKDLFLDHGWRLPDAYRDGQNRSPLNFSLAEWQQAKRVGKDARDIKRIFQEAWSVSDTRDAFAHALEEKGYVLARGDRRGFVAVDAYGEVYAVPKMTGLKTKQVREKLGNPQELPSVDQAKDRIARNMQTTLTRWQQRIETKQKELKAQQERQRRELLEKQRAEREKLKAKQKFRRDEAARMRQLRFRIGLKGLWDRLRGAHRKVRLDNEREAWQAHLRDQQQSDDLIFAQLDERRDQKHAHDLDKAKVSERQQDIGTARDHFREMRAAKGDTARTGPSLDR